MAQGRLPKDKGLILLQKLATDDGFRTRFEADPRAAMLDIGIRPEDLSALKSSCCDPKKIAGKEEFAKLLAEMESQAFVAAMSMHTPNIKLD